MDMDRKEFCEKLVETRNKANVTKYEINKNTGFPYHRLKVIEEDPDNFIISQAIRYLYGMRYMIVLNKPGYKDFGIIDAKQFGDWLSQIRPKICSRYALAKQIGCGGSVLFNIENKKTIPSIDMFLKIIDILGCNIEFVKI
jgi:DNA-binding XRE family transcriptional regulator